MPHDTNYTRSDGAEDGKLNRLIRAAIASQDSETFWPDTEAILAYLHGEGNDEQRRDVQEAIADFAEFRRFLVDTAYQIEELNALELIREFDAIQHKGQTFPGRRTDGGTSTLERIRTRLADLVRIPVFVPVLAAAAILVIGIALDPLGWFESPTTQLHAYAKIDPSIFTSSTPRGDGAEPKPPTIAASAYDAALNEFRACVALDVFDSGEYILRDNPRTPGQEPSAQVVTLNLTDDAGVSMAQLLSYLPNDVVLSEQSIQVWILFVPSAQLWQAEASELSIDVDWNPEMGRRGCITITYPVQSGALATPGVTFAF